MSLFPIIHLEGLDLSGKTSVAYKILERKESWVRRYTTLLEKIEDNPYLIKADRLNNSGSPDEYSLFKLYYQAMVYDAENIPAQKNPLIQDSTILVRSLAGLSVSQYSASDLLEKMLNVGKKYPSFSYSVILTCTHEARLERLNHKRNNLKPEERLVKDDLLIESDPQKFFAKESALVKYSQRIFKSEILDTSKVTIEEISDYILSRLVY